MSDVDLPRDDAPLRGRLAQVTTATATGLLVQRGYQRAFMAGAHPLLPGARVAGRAVTIRLGPGRPDLAPRAGDRMRSEHLFQAVEAIRPGDLLVVDCGGDTAAGTTGDILAARIKRLGGVGVLIDGAVRDIGQIREFVGLPVWARATHGAGYPPVLVGLDRQQPVRCFGVTVLPGDYILADDDGAVAIPAALAPEIAEAGVETERREGFIRRLIEQGGSTRECYPPDEETLRRYEAWKRESGG